MLTSGGEPVGVTGRGGGDRRALRPVRRHAGPDGAACRVLERDPAPPPADPRRLLDVGTPRREPVPAAPLLPAPLAPDVEAELPEVAAASTPPGRCGSTSWPTLPEHVTGGLRARRRALQLLTGRRPVIEAAWPGWRRATPGVTVRRGVAGEGLLAADRPGGRGPPHRGRGHRGRRGAAGRSGGRRRRAALAAPRAARRHRRPPPVEELEDSGFLYYGRHFRSADGRSPRLRRRPAAVRSISILTLPADNGTWGVGLVTSAGDAALRAAARPDVWTRDRQSYPLVAHWLDGEPITGVDMMAKIEDRHRRFVRRRRAGGHGRGRRWVTRGRAPTRRSAEAPRSACSTRCASATCCAEVPRRRGRVPRPRLTRPPRTRSSPLP